MPPARVAARVGALLLVALAAVCAARSETLGNVTLRKAVDAFCLDQDVVKVLGAVAEWETDQVKGMGSLFSRATSSATCRDFDADVGPWDVSKVG